MKTKSKTKTKTKMKTLQLQKGVRKPLITLFVLFLMGITINKALAQCPTTAPPLIATTISNVCPVPTVDLTTLHTATVPAGSVLRWYTDDTHTGAYLNTPTDAPGGTYYAFYYRSNGNCFSPPSVPVIATTECCLANTAPVLSSYSVSNVCPSFTFDLNTLYTGGLPGGITLLWFTNSYHQGTAYSTPGTAGGGTYYAFFYNAGAACYSPASLPVTVTIQCCGSIAAPPLTGTSLSNTCPGTGAVNLNSLHALPAPPTGTQLRWFNNNAHVGNHVLTPTVWNQGGTYYAYYYNSIQGCYSQPSAPVTVVITACTGSCAGITSPALSAVYATITCPSSTYDLNSLHTGVIPAGYELQWRLVSGNTIVPDPSKAGAELYKVRYFNPVLNCGGPDVSVTIDIDHYNCPLDPVVNNINGRYEITADAGGTAGTGFPNSGLPYTITIPKPAGATTIHSVWAYAAYTGSPVTGFFRRGAASPSQNAALNAVTINGTPAPWTNWADSWTDNLTQNISCFVRYGEMSSLLAGTLNAAAPGSTVDITINEPLISSGVQGVGIIVVWNNPTKPIGSHLVMLGNIPTGKLARVELTTAPIDKTIPGFDAVLGAGIVFSTEEFSQTASVKIGESEATKVVSYTCGGYDDGETFGGSITLGGYQDDPLLDATDELYNVVPFLVQGQTHIRIDIQDLLVDANDFLTAVYFTGAGISPAPDLTPTTDIDGLSFTTGEARDFVVNVFEILNNPTVAAGQPVSFRINRLSGWDITVPGLALTGIPQPGIVGTSGVFGGTPNQNDKWLFSQNAGFITVTLMPGEIINALGSMQIGFTATRKAGTVNGTSQNITATIINGSGGEIDFTNNRVITTISSN